MQAPVEGEALLMTVEGAQCPCAQEQYRDMIRPPFDAEIQRGERFLEPLHLVRQGFALMPRVEIRWIELEHMLIGEQRVSGTVEGRERAAKLLPQFGVAGVALHRLVED